MKKILSLFLVGILVASSAFAGGIKRQTSARRMIGTGLTRNASILPGMKGYGNLTFFEDLLLLPVGEATSLKLQSTYGIGSRTATFVCAASGSSPRTYTNASGVIAPANTADTGRIRGGYYDATGFHKDKGLMMESSSTNLLIRTDGTSVTSSRWTGWTPSNVPTGTVTYSTPDNTSLLNIANTTAMRRQYTGIVTDTPAKTLDIRSTSTAVGSVVNGDKVTYSVWIKLSGTTAGVTVVQTISFRNAADALLGSASSSSDLFGSLSTSWRKFTFTATASDALTSRAQAYIAVGGIDNGDTVDISEAMPQLEKLPYATSFIPTTTTALTRPAESLKYVIAGNRTVASETCFLSFTPMSTFANDGIGRMLISTDTKSRQFRKGTTSTVITISPNTGDSVSVSKNTTTNPLAGTTYVVSGVVKHSSPYVTAFTNGTNEGTYTTGNWTDNAWGTYFYIGTTQAGGGESCNSAIKRVAFYSDAKSDADVAKISTLMTK